MRLLVLEHGRSEKVSRRPERRICLTLDDVDRAARRPPMRCLLPDVRSLVEGTMYRTSARKSSLDLFVAGFIDASATQTAARCATADYAAHVKPGPRDHLITEALARELAQIDPALVDREALDGAEGPLRLSRHLAAVVQRACVRPKSLESKPRRSTTF